MRRMIFCLLATGLVASAAWAQPELILEETGVQVSTEPGGSIVLLGTERRNSNGTSLTLYTGELLVDQDADGWVSPELGHHVAWESLWVAVDVATGGYAVEAPPSLGPQIRPLPADLHPGAASLAEQMRRGRMLVVRPGRGAWLAEVADGTTLDQDTSQNGSVAAALEDFEGLGDPPPRRLRNLRPGDTVALLDLEKQIVSIGFVDPSGGN